MCLVSWAPLLVKEREKIRDCKKTTHCEAIGPLLKSNVWGKFFEIFISHVTYSHNLLNSWWLHQKWTGNSGCSFPAFSYSCFQVVLLVLWQARWFNLITYSTVVLNTQMNDVLQPKRASTSYGVCYDATVSPLSEIREWSLKNEICDVSRRCTEWCELSWPRQRRFEHSVTIFLLQTACLLG